MGAEHPWAAGAQAPRGAHTDHLLLELHLMNFQIQPQR